MVDAKTQSRLDSIVAHNERCKRDYGIPYTCDDLDFLLSVIDEYRSALQDIRNDAQRSIDGVVLPRYDRAAAHHLIRVIDNALGGDNA